jgi:hypothetical protein
MADQAAELDDALEQVMAAARAHLAAVKDADGAVDDEQVWRSYVTLNNASFTYDQLLLDRYGEVTPWETELIDLRATERAETPFLTQADIAIGETRPDPYPSVVSVRQRRDYRVPSLAALLTAAEEAAHQAAHDDEEDEAVAAPRTMEDAVLGLVRDSDGSLAGLDIPELEPLAGVITVTEVAEPLDLDTDDSARLFQVGNADKIVGRLDEEPYLEDEDGNPITLEPEPPPPPG